MHTLIEVYTTEKKKNFNSEWGNAQNKNTH